MAAATDNNGVQQGDGQQASKFDDPPTPLRHLFDSDSDYDVFAFANSDGSANCGDVDKQIVITSLAPVIDELKTLLRITCKITIAAMINSPIAISRLSMRIKIEDSRFIYCGAAFRADSNSSHVKSPRST